MRVLLRLFVQDLKKRARDSFLIGYNIIFPIVMILLLGYLTSEKYEENFNGYQYYSVVILPFCIALSCISVAYAGKEEAYKKTAIRFLTAPVSRQQLVLSKLLSCTVIISLCNLLVLFLSLLVLHIPMINQLLPIFLLLFTETFAVSAIGLVIGLGMKNFIMVKNVMNIPIMAAGILAGAFYPFGTLNSGLGFIIKLSPLTWINRGIFLSVYDGRNDILWETAFFFAIAGLLFTCLAVITFKKEEFIHGDLPGYEK
jgi:ABC-2 type transport system permease protein